MPFNKQAIFTSGALPQNRQVSQQFASYGAVGAPTSVGGLRITMVKTKPLPFLLMLLGQLWSLVFALISQVDIDFTRSFSLPPTKETFDMAPRPSLVITIQPKSSENKVKALELAGFTPRVNGRYRYYVGPATDAAVQTAIKEGVVTDAFAPGGGCSVNGIILFSVMSRLFHYAFAILSSLPNIDSHQALAAYKVPTTVADYKLTERKLDELPAKGFFFPYFDGLLLPDHGTTITTFISTFSSLFGPNPAVIAEATRTFMSGWATLNDTIAGKTYSHMMFCLNLSISCGVPLRPVYLAGEYSGCVFYTADTLVSVGTQLCVPQEKSDLRAGVERMQSHESALSEICAILTSVDKDADEAEDVKVISPDSITSARALHNACRTRTLGPDTVSKIAPLLRKLRFEQTLWDVTNPKHVQIATALIVEKTFPDTSVPFNLRIDAVFTKHPIYSILAAFGNKAPSLRGSGTQIVRRIAPKFYESLDKPGRLVGIPVFAKSHQEAKEDWDSILTEYTVFFDSKGKDKEGKLRVKHVSSFITFDSDEGKGVHNALMKLVAKGKKRARDDDEPEREKTQDELDQDAKRKRRKEKGYGMLGLAFGLAQGESSMAVDGEDEDIFA